MVTRAETDDRIFSLKVTFPMVATCCIHVRSFKGEKFCSFIKTMKDLACVKYSYY